MGAEEEGRKAKNIIEPSIQKWKNEQFFPKMALYFHSEKKYCFCFSNVSFRQRFLAPLGKKNP